MLANKLADLECMSEGLYRGSMGSGDGTTGVSAIDHTLTSRTYTDALNRVFSAITKINDAQ